MADYLSPTCINRQILDEIGWWKLVRIRKMTIDYRHILKSILLRKKYTEYIQEFFQKFFAGWRNVQGNFERFLILNLMAAMSRTHKTKRNGAASVLQVFDFDKTITPFKENTDPANERSIYRLLMKGIQPLKDPGNKKPFLNPDFTVRRIIVSAGGSREQIARYLEKHNQLHLFDRIYALGGEKHKAHYLWEIRQARKYDLVLYYDDSPLFYYGSLTLFFTCYAVMGTKIRKVCVD